MLFVVTGPSGCGKSTIIHHVMRDLRSVRFSVSHTTRPPRPSEQERPGLLFRRPGRRFSG